MLYLGHDSIGVTQFFPPFAWEFRDEIPSPDGDNTTLWIWSAMTAGISEMWGKAHNYPAFGEIIYGGGKRIFDSHRKTLQGTMTETVDGH